MLRSVRSSQHGGKLRELNIIESQLNEMHTKIANIEKTVSRQDREVKSLENRTKKPEKNVQQVEEAIQYKGDDNSEIECQ